MAKRIKPPGPKPDDIQLPTDDEIMAQWVGEIRQQIANALSGLIEGPLPERGADGFALRLCEGDQWYRVKVNLDKRRTRNVKLLTRAAIDLHAAESAIEYGQRIPTIFGCALRIGQFTEQAKVLISVDNHSRSGPKPKLSDNDKIQIRIAKEKGRSVRDIACDYKVKRDTIYRVLKTEVSHK